MIKGYYKVGVYLLIQDLNPTRWEPKAKNYSLMIKNTRII